ncbi:MAG: hypothetical protein K2O67_00135, partial [Clostridia bacterium]|nr:hypothetical protein [Clostridia bacterium]
MKKLAKIITVSAGIALIGSAAWAVGCQKPHSHVFGAYQPAGEEGHHRPAVCQGHQDVYSPVVPHNFGGGTSCIDCGYAKKPEMPEHNSNALSRADGIIIEGLSQNKINLTENYTSHSVDRNAVFVYLALNGNKISDEALPVEVTELTLTDPTGEVLTDWTNLRTHGIYTLTAKVKTGDKELACSRTIDINNPVLPDTLAVKEGAVLSQPKSHNDYMTAGWQYEISLQNGDKIDVDAASVKIEGLD